MTILHSFFNEILDFLKNCFFSPHSFILFALSGSHWFSLLPPTCPLLHLSLESITIIPVCLFRFLPHLTSLLLFPPFFLFIFSFLTSPSCLVRCSKIDFQLSEASHTGKVNQGNISSELFWVAPLTAVNDHWGKEKKGCKFSLWHVKRHMGSQVGKWKTLVNTDFQWFVVTCWLLQSPSFSGNENFSRCFPQQTLLLCQSALKTLQNCLPFVFTLHFLSPVFFSSVLKKTLAFWHPITNSGGARHFCKHGWTMHVVLCSGSFMTSGKLLIQCALVSSHQDFQIFLRFIWGNWSFKKQGGNIVLLFLSFACPCVFPAA